MWTVWWLYFIHNTELNITLAYSKKVVERFESVLRNPEKHSVGRFNPKDHDVATGMVGAPACGDVMKLQLKLDRANDPDKARITDVKFKTYGCGSAIASSSLLTEWVKGKTLNEATEIKNTDIAEELALPPVKIHCSVLAEDAIKTAIADLQGKQEAQGKWQPK